LVVKEENVYKKFRNTSSKGKTRIKVTVRKKVVASKPANADYTED
jgi:hypothetical protein